MASFTNPLGQYFKIILHFLRTGTLFIPPTWTQTQIDVLYREAEFYLIDLPTPENKTPEYLSITFVKHNVDYGPSGLYSSPSMIAFSGTGEKELLQILRDHYLPLPYVLALVESEGYEKVQDHCSSDQITLVFKKKSKLTMLVSDIK